MLDELETTPLRVVVSYAYLVFSQPPACLHQAMHPLLFHHAHRNLHTLTLWRILNADQMITRMLLGPSYRNA